MPPLKSLTERNRHGGLKQFVINFPVEKLKKKRTFSFLCFGSFAFPYTFFPNFPSLFRCRSVSMPLGIHLMRKVIVVFRSCCCRLCVATLKHGP